MDKEYKAQLLNTLKQYRKELADNAKEIENEQALLKKAKNNNDKNEIKASENYLLWKQDEKHILEKTIDELRLPLDADIAERKEIAKNFAKEVDEMIPDDDLIYFHGIGNIGIVEEIITDGALLSQKDRGYVVSFSSYMICVTPKNRIQQSVNMSGGNTNYCKPYGAIFVLSLPERNKSDLSSDLISISSIDFRDEPDKLVAIITSNENLERLKKVAKESGIDENKITNHAGFLEMYKKKSISSSYK